jgi:hypothetical protein
MIWWRNGVHLIQWASRSESDLSVDTVGRLKFQINIGINCTLVPEKLSSEVVVKCNERERNDDELCAGPHAGAASRCPEKIAWDTYGHADCVRIE